MCRKPGEVAFLPFNSENLKNRIPPFLYFFCSRIGRVTPPGSGSFRCRVLVAIRGVPPPSDTTTALFLNQRWHRGPRLEETPIPLSCFILGRDFLGRASEIRDSSFPPARGMLPDSQFLTRRRPKLLTVSTSFLGRRNAKQDGPRAHKIPGPRSSPGGARSSDFRISEARPDSSLPLRNYN